jgi:hypothetical protein
VKKTGGNFTVLCFYTPPLPLQPANRFGSGQRFLAKTLTNCRHNLLECLNGAITGVALAIAQLSKFYFSQRLRLDDVQTARRSGH